MSQLHPYPVVQFCTKTEAEDVPYPQDKPGESGKKK